jgi:hypothetical protein
MLVTSLSLLRKKRNLWLGRVIAHLNFQFNRPRSTQGLSHFSPVRRRIVDHLPRARPVQGRVCLHRPGTRPTRLQLIQYQTQRLLARETLSFALTEQATSSEKYAL